MTVRWGALSTARITAARSRAPALRIASSSSPSRAARAPAPRLLDVVLFEGSGVALRGAVCDGAVLAKLGLEGEQQCLVVREGHSVRLPGMALDLCDELFLVRRTGFEPAVAMQNLVHDWRR